MFIAASLVVESLIQNPNVPQQKQMDDLFVTFCDIDNDKDLFEFIHYNERNPCKCMASLAPKTKTKCGACTKNMDKPKRCSRCKNEWFCNIVCQKGAWKTHKKVCREVFG